MSSLNVAARALTTNLAVLQNIGHNIANANTVGYSRQTTQLQQVPGQQFGSGYFGKGVEIATVRRAYDAFLTRQANATQTLASSDAVRLQKLQQVEGLFPLGEGSLGEVVNTALNAWVDVQTSPSDSTARGVVIGSADHLASRIRETASRLEELGTTARLQTAEVVKSINTLATQIADINQQISRVQSASAVPNDLLDQRDQLIAELGQKIQITTIGADDGTTTVFAAGSLPLVLGSQAAQLRVDRATLDGDHRQVISFVQGGTAFTVQDALMVGGELKGLQDFVNTDLTQTQAQLGRMALALATEINQQHRSGLDLAGNAGTDFFSVGNLLGTPATGNGGSATLSMVVADATVLQPSDYEVTYATPGTVSIRRLADGQFVAGSPVPVGLPVTFDGLTLSQPAGAAVAGDRFVLRPAADAAKNIDVVLSAPSQVAVASRLSVTLGGTNTGTTTIEAASTTLVQGSYPVTLPPVTLTFNTATSQFTVPAPALPATVTPAAIAYTPGQPVSFTYNDGLGNQYSYSLTLRGAPANGDTFQLAQTPASAVRFNAGNAHTILALRDQVTFDGNTTLSDAYVPVFSNVASRLQSARFSAEFSQAQAASAETQRANLAGVNLDEEAANLIQYQQAYQASAKYLNTVQSLFDTLMSAFS